MRRLAALVLAAGLAFVALPTAPAVADDGNNIVSVVNTKDGADIFKMVFDIRRVTGDVVDNGNAAIAYASCTDCKTVAIAIQIVFVTGNPSTVAPENVAIAVNENCTACETLASAYQFVVSTNGPVTFTKDGWRRLREIRKGLERLRQGDLPIAEIQTRLDALMDELGDVLRTELVPVDRHRDDDDRASPTSTPTATMTADPVGSPATTTIETASPTVSPSSSEAATTAPTATVTP
ncbi:MAG: putative peptide zinc metalloprotease protein [Frankiaceae bacterium]|jgi:putative peptide zinc metalloprotease protein|nr:putative peptide zinc metalloprotease protein [Frankiaceae bacterium]